MQIRASNVVKTITAIFLFSLVAACATTSQRYPGQPAVAVGSSIELKVSADIPLQQDRVHVQDSEVMSEARVDQEKVYCAVRVKRVQESGMPQLKIEPGVFKVLKVRLSNDYVHNMILYANNDDKFAYPSFGVDYRTEIFLKSDQQPQVFALVCTSPQAHYAYSGLHPSRSDIETTMGNLISLR